MDQSKAGATASAQPNHIIKSSKHILFLNKEAKKFKIKFSVNESSLLSKTARIKCSTNGTIATYSVRGCGLGVAPHVGGGHLQLDGDGRRRLRGRAHLHAARAQRVRQLRQVRQLRVRQRLPPVLTARHRLRHLLHHLLRRRHCHHRCRTAVVGKHAVNMHRVGSSSGTFSNV